VPTGIEFTCHKYLENKMPNKYRRSDVALFIGRVMLGMRKMKAELSEHRHFIERSVEQETMHLSKRIALLESCNATLSGKLAQAYQEIAALKQPPHDLPSKDTKQNGGIVKSCAMGSRTRKPAGANTQEKWGEHATAA